MAKRRSVSVIVPFYNEREYVPLMAARLRAVFDHSGGAWLQPRPVYPVVEGNS